MRKLYRLSQEEYTDFISNVPEDNSERFIRIRNIGCNALALSMVCVLVLLYVPVKINPVQFIAITQAVAAVSLLNISYVLGFIGLFFCLYAGLPALRRVKRFCEICEGGIIYTRDIYGKIKIYPEYLA